MENLKETEALERRIDKILQDREAETAAILEKIKEESEAIEKAQKEMEAATVAGDAKAYSKAKAKRAEAADAKEMHETRLDTLTNRPLISKDEYERASNEIREAVATLENQKRDQLAELSEKMNVIAQEMREVTDKANAALRRLQHNVYRDADIPRGKNGELIVTWVNANSVKDTSGTYSWGRSGVEHYQYRLHRGLETR